MYREEYPRPQWKREQWLNLNGSWEFGFDKKMGMCIEVPFAYQTKLSGIHDESCHDEMWYQRNFKVPSAWSGKNVILHFGAVDYRCDVYINHHYVGSHEGGHTSFSFDITKHLTGEQETIQLYVFDPSYDQTIPRGKQTWEEQPRSIWYTRTSGIWQTVWLEPVDESFIKHVKMTPNIDLGNVTFDIEVSKPCVSQQLEIQIKYQEQLICKDVVYIQSSEFSRSFEVIRDDIFGKGTHGLEHSKLWSPEYPNLFDVTFKVIDNNHYILDTVDSYFGMRKIHSEKGKIFLNNQPYYQKLVLNQGYWKDGLLTAPSDKDYIKDIEMMKAMGFNGCRIHQKVEDPRFLYWADKLGFIVWGECAAFISYTNQAATRLHKEWFEIIERDYNHPSIVTWTPINESWGVPDIRFDKTQQAYALGLYYTIKSLDPTRLVVSNDGWESVTTDICGVHNYTHSEYEKYVYDLSTAKALEESMPASRYMYALGYKNEGEPFLLTEFGGIAFGQGGWGYSTVGDEDTFVEQYRMIIEAISKSEALHGFCYTQLSDVQQEINGLVTFEREFKCNPEKIKKINNLCK